MFAATNDPIDPIKQIGDDATATFENDPKFIEPTPGSEGSSDNVEEQQALHARDTDDSADSDAELENDGELDDDADDIDLGADEDALYREKEDDIDTDRLVASAMHVFSHHAAAMTDQLLHGASR
ncbi:hypothetical protein ACFQBQ_13380 [Granulicella cerasi]|uniref:Uncharacterized protein n=1 Tax=Granulicella cerasi TaxID=741063 RepID=A0ABW1ZC87_9BACT|nr:hypothetical protein [Granulicella cerasi]